MSVVPHALERVLDANVIRFRQRGRLAVAWMVRLTAAAVASYVIARWIFPRSDALLAPLTALLVVQLTPVSLLTSGIQRVVSVVAGVALAVLFSSVVPLTWWSLAILIGVSILIGQALRLGPNVPEVPISAMLVMGVGARGAETAAWQRIAETLVGAGVGVLSNLLFPPRMGTEDAGTAIEKLAEELARLLDTAGEEVVSADVASGQLTERASRWLGEARQVTHDIPNVGTALLHAEESRRLNLRALRTPDSGPGLRHGLEALEHSAVAVRSMFRSFVDASAARASQGRDFDQDLREAFALLLHDLATGVRSFGRLVRAEAHPDDRLPELGELREALAGLHEARARVTDVLLVDPRADAPLAELNLALLTTVERLLREMDLDERIRRQARRLRSSPRRLVTRPRREDSDKGGDKGGDKGS